MQHKNDGHAPGGGHRQDHALSGWARSLGRTVGGLTEEDKRAAFENAASVDARPFSSGVVGERRGGAS